MNVDSHSANEGQRVPPVDYFAVLGVPRRYVIDKDELEHRYLDRSKEVHPDRFVGAAASERINSLSASMQLNEAYKALKSDRSRAEHLLALFGVVIGGNEQLDPSFLMEILEAREELAEAQAKGDSAAVMKLEDGMLDRREAALATVATLFAEIDSENDAVNSENDDAGGASPRLATIKRELIILRYVDRYLEAAIDEID